jgi:hypothetical protein
MPGRSLSEEVERSSVGQLVISALIVLTLLVEIGTNLPASAVERSVGPTSGQISFLLGNEQAWGVFAPDPRSTSLQFEGRITFADGSHATWHIPTGSSWGENLRLYRWRKWLERVRSDGYTEIWPPTARWIASLYAHHSSPVAQVQLVRRFHDNTVSDPQPPWKEFVYYTLDLPKAGA